MHRWTWLLVASLAMAGCSDDTTKHRSASAATEDLAVHAMDNITFAPAARTAVETYEGSFPITDGQGLLGPAAGVATDPHRMHDIQGMLGAGPNVVRAEVTQGGDDFAIGLVPGDPGAIWTYNNPGGRAFEAAVVSGGSLDLIVTFLGTSGADALDHADGADYEVTVTVEQDPERIPTGMALEVRLAAAGSHVMFEGRDGPVPDVFVFDPADALVAIVPGGQRVTFTIDENATRGAYVFLPSGHGATFSLAYGTMREDDRPMARILKQVIDTDGPEAIPSGGPHLLEWSLSDAGRPLQAGVCINSQTGGGSNMWAHVIGPDGEELATASVPTSATAFATSCHFTPMGDERFQEGPYKLTYNDQGSHGVHVQAWLVFYGR